MNVRLRFGLRLFANLKSSQKFVEGSEIEHWKLKIENAQIERSFKVRIVTVANLKSSPKFVEGLEFELCILN